MDREQVWQAIDGRRLDVAELLEQLSDDERRRDSLCRGWTVRDVAAHLTLQQLSVGSAAAAMIRARGDVDRLIHDMACRRAALPTQRLIAEIRGTVGSRRHNPGVTHLETLIDILVHGQDIAVPLGRRLETPVDAAATAATRAWELGRPFHAKKKAAGFALTATDTSWSAGEGLAVRAPIGDLLLLLTGRLVVLPRLEGEGADGLSARLLDAADGGAAG
ncbi:maleylpyruvate isomerase family mycothiol-dependent enzyme [Streptomyces sp. NPDC048389]|uniref:maleylpyruvate isomerase family mycothiol-dependent enzyme n=1 Tax=Streptomyces sp. NPDC048389 TaxID=3154622 RepID=UPI0034561EEF